MTEREWQSRVTDFATLRKWRWYHTHDARRSNPGYPDLTLVRRGRLIFAELKSQTGRLTPHQREWLGALNEAAEAYCWRPSDWPEVQAVLS